MPPFSSLEGILWVTSTLLTVALALRLWRIGLLSRYPAFGVFLIFGALRSIFVATVHLSRSQYTLYYVVCESIMLLLYTMMTLEVYTLVLRDYRGIQSLSRWVLGVVMILSMGLAGLSLYPHLAHQRNFQRLEIFYMVERGFLSGLLFLIVLMTLFLVWFPMVMPRNVAVHVMLFAVYFTSKSSVLLVQNIMRQPVNRKYSIAVFLVSLVCLALWFALLRPTWEKLQTTIVRRWDKESEEKLIGQLQGINSALAKTGRK